MDTSIYLRSSQVGIETNLVIKPKSLVTVVEPTVHLTDIIFVTSVKKNVRKHGSSQNISNGQPPKGPPKLQMARSFVHGLRMFDAIFGVDEHS